MSMYLVNENEHVIYHWENSKDGSDGIAITDKRLYHHNKIKNVHTCVNIKDVQMVKFSTKRVKQEGGLQTLLKILLLLSFLATVIMFTSKNLLLDILTLGDNSKFIPLVISVLLIIIYILTRYTNEAVMEIEYGAGNKIDISMKIESETTMFHIRDAIFTAIDENEKTL